MIYITGDTHQNIDISKLNTKNFPEQKELTKSDYVIICGDFGMVWNNSKEEMYWRKWLEKKNFTTLFIDGNHENYELLNEFPIIEKFGGKVQEIGKNIFHLMRGEIYTIDGKTFFCMGGAESTDKIYRIEHISWWKEEMPNVKELDYGIHNLSKYNNEVDYIITHSVPSSLLHTFNADFTSNNLTDYFDHIKDNVKFKYWFSGHYHLDKDISENITLVYNKKIKI